MKKNYAITFIAMLASLPVNAAELKHSVATCAILEGDLERLECYDTLAEDNKLDKPQTVNTTVNAIQKDDNWQALVGMEPPKPSKWSVNEKSNPIDDSQSVYLHLKADSGKSRRDDIVTMLIRCKSNKTELMLTWHDFLGRNVDVLTRIGNEKARTKRWSVSTDSKATFHPTGTIAFIKQMEKYNKLLAQVTPYSESPITAIFDTTGLSEALIPLKKTCNWK
ncbi:MAG: hypothetical protein JKY93_00995 [Gammaproteobacteria bacterium]|nr:hypothetical protein [Gammaproteobacteria bacterium]